MYREEILGYIENQFMGPSYGEPHILKHNKDYLPYQHLITGMLFPQESDLSEEAIADQNSTASIVDTNEDPLSLSFTYLTASVGMSLHVPNDVKEILITTRACVYEKESEDELPGDGEKEEFRWSRKDLPEENSVLKIKTQKVEIFNGKAEIDLRVFDSRGKKLLTVTLINNSKKESQSRLDQKDVLCRVSMECSLKDNNFLPYPKVFRKTADGEEEEQQILYKDEHIFGVGHACSVNWSFKENTNDCAKVSLDFIPKEITIGSKSELDEYNGSESINMEYLANPENTESLIKSLIKFVEPYENWVDKTCLELKKLKQNTDSLDYFEIGDAHKKTIDRLVNKLNYAVERIHDGINFISNDSNALKAFQFANKAVLMQMVHAVKYNQLIEENNLDYMKFQMDHEFVDVFQNINYFDLKSFFGKSYKPFNWRPFQLAYFLTTCKSVVLEDDENRSMVDLIWFATGGGKTEAYLFVSAFLIFYRKLIDKNHDQVEILMRYTLRLLTQDQFVRSSRLIAACEKIRRENVDIFGNNEISLGLWIGGSSSPNKFVGSQYMQGSSEQYIELLKNDSPNSESPFSISMCPWCSTNLVPDKQSDEKCYGFKSSDMSFELYCPSQSCEFHEKLPIQVVDQAIYQKPPTFLLATIDKFAQLAQVAESGKILNKDFGSSLSLIIQDELHLISGPLGTVTGAVEAVFDVLLKHFGAKPKYIAATATIRGAKDQVERLYARDVNIFPPSGINHKDRFFSREDTKDPGRLYVGVMSQGHTAITTRVRIASALSQSVEEIPGDKEVVDGYHTLVIYHNSRNEKSKTKTLAVQDIPERIKQIASLNDDFSKENIPPRLFGENGIGELSSDVQHELFETRKRLELMKGQDDAIDIVSVTNIIQVGIDIPRLALMQVTGQPKTTSEFIQATSRVGRGKNKGLVVVNYLATNPRDRSHYEQFKGYISSVNRFVEPTSVTPAAEPCLRRVLPTCLLILAKHGLGLTQNRDAQHFDSSSNEAKELIKMFKDRMINADKTEKANIEKLIDSYIDDWEKLSNGDKVLTYHAKFGVESNKKALTRDFGDEKNEAEWEILTSMRHVDTEVGIKIE